MFPSNSPSLDDELLEDLLNDFIARSKPPSHHTTLIVHDSCSTNEEELKDFYPYVLILIPSALFEKTMYYLVVEAR